MNLWRKIYESEIDLKIERRIAHLFGWHSDGCRGFGACGPWLDPEVAGGRRHATFVQRRRWHRWIVQ